MPKSRKVVKKDGVVKRLNVPTKFRIGTRKSGVSAHTLSTKRLLEIITDKSKTKYHHVAHEVLALRNRGMLKQLVNNYGNKSL